MHSPFLYPAFATFWLMRVAATLGFQITAVAVGWQIYELTDSPMALGLIGLVQLAPLLLLALPVGHMADQFDRRLLTLLAEALCGLAFLSLTILSLLNVINETVLLVLVALVSIGKTFEQPATESIMPALVPRDALTRATSVYSSGRQLAYIAGPALGGLLYVVSPSSVYGIAAMLQFGAIILTLNLPYRHAPLVRSLRRPAA
jgi:MFS family permease